MTELEQEAKSHQHSHGVWVVGLSDGSFALFDHPNGKLITIVELERAQEILDACLLAALRYSERNVIARFKETRSKLPGPKVSLEDLFPDL
jgi:hypothetical protein